ncbi:hypothetical protein KC343_g13037 [Hortaea werneckii]|nr:hypothetical protein KC352_g23739 [Hortaea werneckii]KAI7601296.1 hypothetical protein KC346_g12886 [Hortaea werneckii]KAI7607517.1 hypothetical protein KC343_g13037 [Hortaea werneckii]KAI7619771.1 hypothetical protein KC319_g18853 [Hortaea werneckii]KAI7685657.1 hypothetical protein KC322_g13020 [Hortaea werneckii]
MDPLRCNVAKATTFLKAANARLTVAQTTFAASQTAFNTALKNFKADSTPQNKSMADKAAKEMREAQTTLTTAEQEVEARTQELSEAKNKFNAHFATRSRRPHKLMQDMADRPAGQSSIPCTITTADFFPCAKTILTSTDYATLTAFPPVPSAPCSDPVCTLNKPHRALEACEHTLRSAFAGCKANELKTAADLFDPARFEACGEAVRAELVAKAGEVFAVVKAVQKGVKAERKAGWNQQQGGKRGMMGGNRGLKR